MKIGDIIDVFIDLRCYMMNVVQSPHSFSFNSSFLSSGPSIYKVLLIFYVASSQLLSHKLDLFLLGAFNMAQYSESMPHIVLILFLGLLFVLSASAVPATRGGDFFSNEEEVSLLTWTTAEGAVDQKYDDMSGAGEEFAEGRMDLETKDYPGAGPNTHHDPNPPGRSG